MKKLNIKKTPKTPGVIFNSDGDLSVFGVSVPENSMAFYQPVIAWVKEYVKNPADNTVLTFKLEYINTSSLQFVYDVLILVSKTKKNAIVNWHYIEDDDDMKETGEDYEEATGIPFKYIKDIDV